VILNEQFLINIKMSKILVAASIMVVATSRAYDLDILEIDLTGSDAKWVFKNPND